VPAFRNVIDVPLVVRRLHKSREEVCFRTQNNVNELIYYGSMIHFLVVQVRKNLGVGDDVKIVIFNFGGQVRFNLGCHDILVSSSTFYVKIILSIPNFLTF
jgi:hypothetical protein